jgi:hypothetical protein
MAGLPVDLSGLSNLHRMANTPDPFSACRSADAGRLFERDG